MKRLYRPRSVPVSAGSDGSPRTVGGKRVTAVREEWLVEEGWWSGRSLRRRYFELVLEDGSDVVVFRDLGGSGEEADRWFRQRA